MGKLRSKNGLCEEAKEISSGFRVMHKMIITLRLRSGNKYIHWVSNVEPILFGLINIFRISYRNFTSI